MIVQISTRAHIACTTEENRISPTGKYIEKYARHIGTPVSSSPARHTRIT